ncbi:GntR family transcriptional regulator [Arthrobacter crystallopoietes BAB-32]|uniref:GntR family transcriptional regulator n=1 Tax=Arthrobacter crystallopoietes BAB-32 TaxID=1246476 RepID=N1UY67_9MICC|nr:GntR family transcriptional regulator [Arthrobacter crystallopoietes]EMY34010.1 GntR family transcriptional regulator [Arthrobacter crystallopoietes BAB-32]
MAAIPNDVRPLAVRVYEQISADIISGTITPGSALAQEHIAAQYGVSRTPVRDALTQLTLEGLTTLVPGKGYIVNQLDEREIENVFEVRYALESLAVQRAVGSYTPKQLVRLKGLIDETETVDPQDTDELFRLGRAFHLALVAPSGNDYLNGVITSIWNHPIQQRINTTYRQGPQHQAKVIHDHRSILQALKDQDIARAIEVLGHCHDVKDTNRYEPIE